MLSTLLQKIYKNNKFVPGLTFEIQNLILVIKELNIS